MIFESLKLAILGANHRTKAKCETFWSSLFDDLNEN